jgi:prepilin-type N-terminal cleavage/methylation domain-containing protein
MRAGFDTAGRRGGQNKAGLSLIELLLVITVMAILGALLYPAINKVRNTARERQSSFERRIIGQAIDAYRLTNRRFPAPEPHQGGSTRTYSESGNGGNNGQVMRLLREANPPFIDENKFRWDGDGIDANVLNPWGKQYQIRLELAYTFQGSGYQVNCPGP